MGSCIQEITKDYDLSVSEVALDTLTIKPPVRHSVGDIKCATNLSWFYLKR